MQIDHEEIEVALDAILYAMAREDPIVMDALTEEEARDLARVALTAAAPFIRAKAINECALRIELFGVEIQMQGTMGRLADLVRTLAKDV